MSAPTYNSLKPSQSGLTTLEQVEEMAHKSAYDLLSELNSRATNNKWLQICTSESLTAGMIMSTLVDIPWGGYLKYGAFAVYDTDAKRVFNKVSVDDVYTHRCAKEMAVGILKNSNATLAIAVTGNAMPLNEHADMLGEVFIGVAGYKTDANGKTSIIYQTTSINACDNELTDFQKTCDDWYQTIKRNSKYNPRDRTALVSREIRNYTTYRALNYCLEFVKNNNPDVPDFVLERKKKNNTTNANMNHTTIPENKFNDQLDEVCVSKVCHDVSSSKRSNTATYENLIVKSPRQTAGRRKTRKSRR
jgi:nicotinamide mononucleotide (NMN) deamidase PncC